MTAIALTLALILLVTGVLRLARRLTVNDGYGSAPPPRRLDWSASSALPSRPFATLR